VNGPTELKDVLLEWRETLLSSGRIAVPDFPQLHTRYLAQAVAKGDPTVAHGRLAQSVIDVYEEAFEYVRQHGNVTYQGAPWTPPQRPAIGLAAEAPTLSGRPATKPAAGSRDLSPAATSTTLAPQPAGPWAPYEGDPPEPTNNLAAHVADGQATISWTPVGGPGRSVYRITYNDEFRPYRPEAGTTLVELEASCVIPMPTAHAVRHVQVWEHTGHTLDEARACAPNPVANGVLVAQPSQMEIKEDHGQVFCRWSLPNSLGDYGAIEWVEVRRHLVIEETVSTAAEIVDAEFGGFHDTSVEPGRDYLYRITAMARVDGAYLASEVVEATVRIPAPLQQVTDLSCMRVEDRSGKETFTLEWSVPVAGVVRVYRTPTELRGGYAGRAMKVAELPDAELTASAELPHPVGTGSRPGTARMSGIARPSDWPTMYLTPVTVLRDEAMVGTTITGEASMAAPGNFAIFERVFEQHLRFGWPNGADVVRVYIGPKGQTDPDKVLSGGAPLKELTQAQWRRSAAVAVQLPPSGATVIVRSGRSEAGRIVEGSPAIATYLGLLRLRYSCQIRKTLFGKPAVEVSVGLDDNQLLKPKPGWSPYFVLNFRPDRLPLHADDGVALVMAPKDGGASPGPRWKVASLLHGLGIEVWRTQLPERRGYVRLFVAESPDRLAKLALIDPAVSSLRVT
jgi:hypothetical protein